MTRAPPRPLKADKTIEEDHPAEETRAVVVTEFVAARRKEVMESYVDAEPDPEPIEDDEDMSIPELESSGFTPIPRKRPPGVAPWTTAKGPKDLAPNRRPPNARQEPRRNPEAPKLKLGIKPAGPQSELSLDSAPRGRFEGENPNVFEGEDLDLPPFLRKKK